MDRFSTVMWPKSDNNLIMGDLNAHHPLWDDQNETPDEHGEKIADFCIAANFDALNDGSPTRHHTNQFTAPDVALCHTNLTRYVNWELGCELGSDHLPMIVKINLSGTRDNVAMPKKFNFRKANWQKFTQCSEEEWGKIPVEQNPSCGKLAKQFEEIIIKCAQKTIPFGTRTEPKPWLEDQPELLMLMTDRANKRRLYNSTKNADDYRDWMEARKLCADQICKVKESDWHRFCGSLDAQTEPTKVSRVMKRLDEVISDRGSDQALVDNGKIACTSKQKANVFVKTYSSVSKLAHRRCDKKIINHVKKFLKKKTEDREEWHDIEMNITENELTKNLKKMKDGKAPGCDKISSEMLKHLGQRGKSTLLNILNLSWNDGQVPDRYRRAKIVPIPKAGKDPTLPSSYRPISLTSHVVKLLERLKKDCMPG